VAVSDSVTNLNPAKTGLEAYAVNNVLDGVPMYIGKVKADGRWVVEKYDSSAGTLQYANYTNNPGIIGYGSAWTQRATLVYGGFETITDL
jgi:hypothetical protein